MNTQKSIKLGLSGYGGRTRLAEQVAEQLSQRIHDGVLQPGDQLPTEAELVADLGVSRSVVREAVATLRSEGLVEPRQGKGVFVIDWASRQPFRMDPRRIHYPADLFAVMELRREVESGAAALAAERRSDAELARLEHWLAEMAAAADGSAASDADVAFHAAVAEATHNAYYRRLTQYLDRQLRLAVAASHRPTGYPRNHSGAILEEHRRILEAIRLGDSEGARAAVRFHLNQVIVRLGLEEGAHD